MRAPKTDSSDLTPREYAEFQRLAKESSDEAYGWLAAILALIMMAVAL